MSPLSRPAISGRWRHDLHALYQYPSPFPSREGVRECDEKPTTAVRALCLVCVTGGLHAHGVDVIELWVWGKENMLKRAET
jgi:hypothetical protein